MLDQLRNPTVQQIHFRSSVMNKVLKNCASINYNIAMQAQKELSKALAAPLNKGVTKALSGMLGKSNVVRYGAAASCDFSMKDFRDCRYDIIHVGLRDMEQRLITNIKKEMLRHKQTTFEIVKPVIVFEDSVLHRRRRVGFICYLEIR